MNKQKYSFVNDRNVRIYSQSSLSEALKCKKNLDEKFIELNMNYSCRHFFSSRICADRQQRKQEIAWKIE